MSTNRGRVREIFFGALERDGADRSTYVAEMCGGDKSLRAEVASLLEHHDEAPLVEGPPSAPLRALAATVPTVQHSPAARARKAAVGREPRYQTLRELGAGGFGVVVQRYDRTLRRMVACKAPLVGESAHEVALLREARLLAFLEHPGVVQVYDLQEDQAGVCYTMELLDGECLSERLAALQQAARPMAISEALRITTRVCETVAHAHAKGVVHLDLKPDNVMLLPFGHVAVIDWGMARFFDPGPYRAQLEQASDADPDSLLDEGPVGGTPAYMPPEQFDPSATPGPAADVYAAGGLLFEMLTGQRAFARGATPNELLAMKKEGAPAVRDSRPEVSERLAALCEEMLAASPEDRPASLMRVLADIASLSDVTGGSKRSTLESGEVLFAQGAESTTAYQVLSGALHVVVDDAVVATRRTGDIVGELAMLSGQRRSATVRAVSATVVRPIDWAALEGELSKVDPLVGRLLRNLSDKLIETTRD